MDFSELMTGFCSMLDIEGAEPDTDGAYHFEIDEMPVSFMELESLRQIVVWGDVGEMPPGSREQLYKALMEAMFMGEGTGGSSFSIDRESGRVVLQHLAPLAVLDEDSFKAMVERFVNVLEEWRKLIADFRDVAPELERAAETAEEENRNFGLGGFIQV